ncbi:hypothetical protein [Halobaculum sp. EA56]|uniref:hypothetical protein n=1 Tax=Halobaculum sp. EA56 TaxID=3421648 RepID=UPI003EB977B4
MAELSRGTGGGGGGSSSDDPSSGDGPIEQGAKAARAVVDTLFNRATSAASQLKNFKNDPARYIFARITEYILTFVFALVFGVVELIESFFDRIIGVIGFTAGETFAPIGDAGAYILRTVDDLNNWVATSLVGAGLPDSLGVFVVFGLYLLELALIARSIPPLLLAGSDLLGSIPVVGSILDAGLTFVLEFIEIDTAWGGDA